MTSRNMTILGTVGYMSPELIAADKKYTEAVDVYALGITICEILTGEDPFWNVKNFLKIYEILTILFWIFFLFFFLIKYYIFNCEF